MKVVISCFLCKKRIVCYKSSKRKFCSKKCNGKFNVLNLGKYYCGYGKNTSGWKGGKRYDERGYVRVWVGKQKWKYEHVMIAESNLGRKLKFNETVHHIDGIKSNNNPSNLIVLTRSDHTKLYHHPKRKK